MIQADKEHVKINGTGVMLLAEFATIVHSLKESGVPEKLLEKTFKDGLKTDDEINKEIKELIKKKTENIEEKKEDVQEIIKKTLEEIKKIIEND